MKVLICHRDSGSQKLVGALAAAIPDFEIKESPPSEPIRNLEGVDIVIAVGKVGRDAMERGTFGFIQTIGTGYEHVDLEAATELGIWVSNMPAGQTGNAESVAEHAILLMLALSRQLARAEAGLKERRWAQPLGLALLGKTACLVGLGDVGTAIASRLLVFGMRVLATRNNPSKGGPAGVEVSGPDSLSTALSAADYVVLCARPSRDNHQLIDAARLAQMKKGAILINIARGELLDHEALLEALRSGHVRGAGLDVYWQEPVDPSHPLFALENVVATPHVAGVTDVNMTRTLALVAANLRRYAQGSVPLFQVNQPEKVRRFSSHFTEIR